MAAAGYYCSPTSPTSPVPSTSTSPAPPAPPTSPTPPAPPTTSTSPTSPAPTPWRLAGVLYFEPEALQQQQQPLTNPTSAQFSTSFTNGCFGPKCDAISPSSGFYVVCHFSRIAFSVMWGRTNWNSLNDNDWRQTTELTAISGRTIQFTN